MRDTDIYVISSRRGTYYVSHSMVWVVVNIEQRNTYKAHNLSDIIKCQVHSYTKIWHLYVCYLNFMLDRRDIMGYKKYMSFKL